MLKYQNVRQLINNLGRLSDKEASKKLLQFYVNARFKVNQENFEANFTDGKDDGGIDFHFVEGSTFHIFQSKFSRKPKGTNEKEIWAEVEKIKKTLSSERPTNRRAETFINAVNRSKQDPHALLEIVWVTTNIVDEEKLNLIKERIVTWARKNDWSIDIDLIAVDNRALESVIYDLKHGFVPYTGKKEIQIIDSKFIDETDSVTGVNTVTCKVHVTEILKWFRAKEDISKYVQKNVRSFVGENQINKEIRRSYKEAPEWFWYKHNGIILFADNYHVQDVGDRRLILRNPQIVNGAQTLSSLFLEYDKDRRGNTAEILVRVYKLPYDKAETYKRCVDIVTALNSQSKILSSDLKSNNTEQVKLEIIVNDEIKRWKYQRKRGENVKASRFGIVMRQAGLLYHICLLGKGNDGVAASVETVFADKSKYEKVFDELRISEDLSISHPAVDIITSWTLEHWIKKAEKTYKGPDLEYSNYARWYLLVTAYQALKELRQTLPITWQDWLNCLESDAFGTRLVAFAKQNVNRVTKLLPKNKQSRAYFASQKAWEKFTPSEKVARASLKRSIKKFYESKGWVK